LGVRTPVRAPQANAVCERFGGTLRRECLDFLIPLNERHLILTLKSWVTYFSHGRPHTSLGPGIPVPPLHPPPANGSRHCIPAGNVIRSTAVLGGLHHEYALEKTAA
jgi:putative transposase